MSKRIVVVGSGVAGLSCALSLIEYGHQVTIITKARTSDSATWYAQGGVASAMFPDDTTQSHIDDTVEAGAGLCDISAVEVLVNEGAHAVERLIARGAQFDTLADGSYARTREGGHRNNRIIHAGGDATGEEIERSLVKAAGDESLSDLNVIDYHMVSTILVADGKCAGVECVDVEGIVTTIEADHVVLATGGAGQLYSVTTNPILATADGIAIALAAGVVCADLEFMQFHPTALHVDNMPRPLLSEALRGEGAVLRDGEGRAFMEDVHELNDLAPRDVVSREIARVLHRDQSEYVFLDATHIENFAQRFPTIFATCEDAGINPSSQFLPVSPAAHYFCGGVVTDIFGATSMPGLWAAGEVACNGVHGANRLASNSLLDGLVYGERVARAIDSGQSELTHTGLFLSYELWIPRLTEFDGQTLESSVRADDDSIAGLRRELQSSMTKNVGVVRTEQLLDTARSDINNIADQAHKKSEAIDVRSHFARRELTHLLTVASPVIETAQARRETRGCHTRDDFPSTESNFLGRHMTRGANVEFVEL